MRLLKLKTEYITLSFKGGKSMKIPFKKKIAKKYFQGAKESSIIALTE